MPSDAIRALGNVGDRHGNELLCLGRQRALGENLVTEGVEGRLDVWGKLVTLLSDCG